MLWGELNYYSTIIFIFESMIHSKDSYSVFSFSFQILVTFLYKKLKDYLHDTLPLTYLLICLFVGGSGVWTWALHWLGRHLTTTAILPSPFCFSYWIESLIFALLAWTGILPFMLPAWLCLQVHTTMPSLRWGPINSLPGLALKWNPPDLLSS